MVKTTVANRLSDIIYTVVSIINHVNARRRKSRVLKKVCKEVGTDQSVVILQKNPLAFQTKEKY